VKPIGTIETPFTQKFGIPRQGCLSEATGRLKLDKSIVSPGALHGLAVGESVWLIFLFHDSQAVKKGKIKPPRLNGESLGIFASRSPHRPNPIGLSLCQIGEIDGEGLSLGLIGVDLLDKTPILDIKPFVSYADSPRIQPEPHWRHEFPAVLTEINKSEAFKRLQKELSIPDETVALVESCVRLDPRPHQQKNVVADHWIQVAGYDFCFQVQNTEIFLKSIKPIHPSIS